MLRNTENQEIPENKYFLLNYKGNGKNTKFEFSALNINGKSICRYTPDNFLKGEADLFHPFVSFRTMLQLILLDKKGKVNFLYSEDFLHAVTLLDKVKYDVETYGSYYTIRINPTDNLYHE